MYKKFTTIMEGDGFALLVANIVDLINDENADEVIRNVKEKLNDLEYIIQPDVRVFGKICKQRRDVVFLSNSVKKIYICWI